MSIQIDSDGGYISLGDRGILDELTVSWGNSLDPFFEDQRLEGYFAINVGRRALEFGAIDQERPGLYITTYKDGDIESSITLAQF